ncbi:methyltransferase-like protein 27 [Saccoglossus kowalevskii]|uniref:Williams-Beuren syndrome chromosomal region 27 protein-like n=1 Tax=Saccoglossus kowalevskii TaxID=10224 RepID=A0ABM0GIR4_SACKO|nr:PREDICTED: Williams-Beuren syndrome chromosomal region 27 protein-like [Saccoglossus kowalevskii]
MPASGIISSQNCRITLLPSRYTVSIVAFTVNSRTVMQKTNQELQDRLAHILNTIESLEGVIEAYDEWADTHDQDQLCLGYGAPFITCDVMREMVPDKSARILDVAAGTGLAGVELKQSGYTNIDALEPSKKLARKAEEKLVYNNIILDTVDTNTLDIDTDLYDAVIACACFLPNHILPSCLSELIRIVKPNGYIIIVTDKEYYQDHVYGRELQKEINQFSDDRKIIQIKREDRPGYYKHLKTATVLVIRVL